MTANKDCIVRLHREHRALMREPVPNVTAHPLPSNLLEWHFVLEGSKGTEYEGGVYHGKIVLPPSYPYKPPSILMLTPNGRFATNTKLCLSMTDYHPESWNPAWSVGTILTGLLSFMYDEQPTTGSITSTKDKKRDFARVSLAFNMKNSTFRKMFPEWVEENEKRKKIEEVRKETGGDGVDAMQTGQKNDATQTNGETPGVRNGNGGVENDRERWWKGVGAVLMGLAVGVVVAGVLAVPVLSADFTSHLFENQSWSV